MRLFEDGKTLDFTL